MRAISASAKAILDSRIMTWCWCWKITPRNLTPLGFTTCDKSLTIGGLVYTHQSGFTPSATESGKTLEVGNLSVESILSQSYVSELDLVKGRYDGAQVDIFWADWTTPTTQIPLFTGTIGNISNDGQRWSAELVALTQKLAQKRLNTTTKTCRYEFGDSKCTRGIQNVFTTVTQVLSNKSFKVANPLIPDLNTMGRCTFTGGDNWQWRGTIQSNTGDTVTLFEPPFAPIKAGDTVVLQSGCRLTRRDCLIKHTNLVNFGGQYHLRDNDFLIQSPSG